MRLSFVLAAAFVGITSAFVPLDNSVATKTSALKATRREFTAAAIGGAVSLGFAAPALAGGPRGKDYVPKFEDLKVLYALGMSLDRLVNKFTVEETVEAGK